MLFFIIYVFNSLYFRSSNNVYGRLPSGIAQDDDNYSLTHSRENLMSPSEDSDTFSPIDNLLHVTNNNLDKQQGNIFILFII